MRKHILAAAVLAALSLTVSLCRADTNVTQSVDVVQPFFTPPNLAMAVGTNWLSQTAAKLEISGVDIITLNGGKIGLQHDGFATEYVLHDYQVANKNLLLRPGLAFVEPTDLSKTYVGAATTVSVIKDSKLEAWLDNAPIFDLVAKATAWSNLYGFITIGSQVDKASAFAAIGGGVKTW